MTGNSGISEFNSLARMLGYGWTVSADYFFMRLIVVGGKNPVEYAVSVGKEIIWSV